jgi:metallophosphoesterase (TIGR03767 family)
MGYARLGGCAAALIAAALAVATGVSYAEPSGHTSEEQTLGSGAPIAPGSKFEQVAEGPPQTRVVRTLPGASALAGRTDRRRSLSYFAQLTDFQLVDEESPARVEFADKGANSAFRPQEAFHPWAIDYSFRQLNQFTGASPHAQAGGAHAPMDLALLTGDHADNQQHNEAVWVRQLIEGGTPLTPNSGIKSDYSECRPENQAELLARETAGEIPDEPTYMGVQDYDDLGFKAPDYYDPDEPFGDDYGTFPTWPGLMDRAQSLTFTPVGLRRNGTPVPTFIANGNHDGLVQGNEDAIGPFEDLATGCFKVAQSTSALPIGPNPDPNQLFSPAIGFAVRPDGPGRHFLDRVQLKRVYSSGTQADGHGFGYVDPVELAASGFSATYWARDLKPGIRFISIDTVSEGGVVQESADGNIDDPQFRWLERELDRAKAEGKLVIAFAHHPIRSLTADPPDEAARHCSGTYDANGQYSNPNEFGHDANPGCDLDPRSSSPIHQGSDLRALFDSHPNVIAYVAGHTHENKVLACGSEDGCPAGANWWEINTSAIADWPEQSRLIELMDNGDGTLSIFGTLTNTAAPVAVPASGTPASGFGNDELASISRAVTMNDPQLGDGSAEGAAKDQNVELLVDDPRTSTLRGTPGNDVIRGTPGRDVILCGAGDDVVITGDGDDVIRCGPGNDTIRSGRGRDRVSGGSGRDRVFGGPGNDRLFGRSGADRMSGGNGRDRLFGGAGRDRLAGQRGNDLLVGGPSLDRLFGGPGRDRRRQ